MKKSYFTLFVFFFFLSVNAQFVAFNDVVFKERLLWANTDNYIASDANNLPLKIDANSNGEIEISEAQNVYGLNIGTDMTMPWPAFISDLTGLDQFVNLKSLNCDWNNIAWA